MTINIHASHQGSSCQIRIEGELTIYTVGHVWTALNDALLAGSEIEIDLSGVTEIDTAGLQWMLAAKVLTRSTLHYVGHSPAVRQLLELSNLARQLHDPIIMPRHDAATA